MPDSIVITFHQLNAQVHGLSQDSPKPANICLDWFDLFENLISWGYEGFQYPYLNSKFCGLIGKVDVNRAQRRIDMVFVVADVDADPQCARNLTNNTTRLLSRNQGEAADKRVHVVFKVDINMPYIAQIAIEHERGISTRLLVNTLNYLLKNARLHHVDPAVSSFFTGEHPTERFERGVDAGKPKPLKFKVKIEYTSVLSDEIIDAFKNGRIKNVEYLRPPNSASRLDNHGVFTQDNLTVHLKVAARNVPSSSSTPSQVHAWVTTPFKELITNNPDLGGTLFTIRFSDASGNARTASYDPQTDEFSLVKKGYISRSVRQPVTQDVKLNTDLCDRMFSKIT